MDVKELKDKDPRRFQAEYDKWSQHAIDYDWWDYTEERFTEYAKEQYGITVDPGIHFSVGYCQSDYASFEGFVKLHVFMEKTGMSEHYHMLHEAVKKDEAWAKLGPGYSYGGRTSVRETNFVISDASGLFEGLDEETWTDMVEDEERSAGLEEALNDACKELCDKLYNDLQEEYEHLTSAESFIESCECNEVTFEETEDEI